MSRRPESFNTFLKTPVILIGSVIFLFVVGIATIRESYRGWQVDAEIRSLEDEARELEGRNKRLMEIADALQQPERMEVEAKKRLGMKEPGEHVVVLDGIDGTSSWEMNLPMDVVTVKPEVEEPNPARWFHYFFHSE